MNKVRSNFFYFISQFVCYNFLDGHVVVLKTFEIERNFNFRLGVLNLISEIYFRTSVFVLLQKITAHRKPTRIEN